MNIFQSKSKSESNVSDRGGGGILSLIDRDVFALVRNWNPLQVRMKRSLLRFFTVAPNEFPIASSEIALEEVLESNLKSLCDLPTRSRRESLIFPSDREETVSRGAG